MVKPISISNSWVPAKVVDNVNIQKYRDSEILNVTVSPIQYNSSKEIVRAYKKLAYRITFLDSTKSDMFENKHDNMLLNDSFLQNTTLNGNILDKTLRKANDADFYSQDYLIISVPKYEHAVSSFAEWKKILGFNTHIILNESWTEYSVRSAIKECYLLTSSHF